MKIIYVHHAERDKGIPRSQNDPITDLGRQDCEIVAELMKKLDDKYPVKAIYTSQFFRCTETAKLISKHLSCKTYIEERFDEFRSHGNETWTEFLTHIVDALNDITQKHNDEDTIICVTSGVNIGGFICWNFGIQPSENIPYLMVPSCSPIGFEYNKNKKDTLTPSYFEKTETKN